MTTTVRELMIAGAHFGHRVRFWNPKMAPYIYGKYHSTHIVNLDTTLSHLNQAKSYLKSIAASGGTILYLCTKRNCDEVISESAKAVSMPYVNHRWLGGIMTNFKTTRKSIDRLKEIEANIESGVLKTLTKKEGIKMMLTKHNLEKAIGGIRDMDKAPDVMFVIDAGLHKGAILEAKKMGIPIVSIVDTNHSPLDIDYVIPGNDDSTQAIEIYAREITEAIAEGKKEWEAKLIEDIKSNFGNKETFKTSSDKNATDKNVGTAEATEKKAESRVIRAKKSTDNSETVTPSSDKS